MFDVFYSGKKPGLFAHECRADSVEHAQQLSRTRYFWWVQYLCDYSDWDWLFEPKPWQAHQRHAWPSQHQPDSGTYLVPTAGYTDTNYHLSPVIHHLPDQQCWHMPKWIDPDSIDPRWSPDPASPPYIYHFAVEWDWDNVGGPEYRVPGAMDHKFVTDFVARTAPDPLAWCTHHDVVFSEELYRWRPNPQDPPYNYVFGNQWYSAEVMPTVEYRVPGATSKKYMTDLLAQLPEKHSNHWHTLHDCEWDYSWVPDPGEPPYVYVFGNQWWPAEKMGTVEYHVPGATERKYMDLPAHLLPVSTNWHVPDNVDPVSVDFSWVPDPGDPPYIYEFATQWQSNGGAVYTVPGAVERKYVDIPHRRLSNTVNWQVPDTIDSASVDYSWHPSNTEQPFVYEFATQWQSNGGAVYTVPGATERKYVDIQHCRLPNKSAFRLLEYIGKFDYSWHPDNTEPPYNYVFGNQHWPGTDMPTVMYEMPGATQEKFVDGVIARLGGCMGNWRMFEDIDDSAWDWTWQPNPKDPPYIYAFGNQWNPPEHKVSIQYEVEGATEIKHMELRTHRLPQPQLFAHNLAVSAFDYSWEPNPFDPPMTYVFGNQWNSAVLEPTVIHSTGGTEIKYMDELVATLAQDVSAWELLDDIESFDYSWRPNPTDPPYIYVFGNQWLVPEQRPALQYRVTGATERKFMTHPQAQRRGDATRFVQHYAAEFDWSWEPDPGAPPYNYVFGNQYHSAEIMPTVEYRMPGATERKYMDIPALLLPNPGKNWHMIIQSDWDYSWQPEPGSPAYIYVFGNQWWSAEKMPTVEYHMPGAVERKYMSAPEAKLPVDMTLWHVPANVDTRDMDFSWVPDPGEPPYVYQFATQHQKTGGPQYRVPGATEFKYVDMMRVEVVCESVPVVEIDHLDGSAGQIANTIKRIRYFDNYRDTLIRLAKSLAGQHEYVWVCSSICDYSNFDFSWHPERWQSTMLHVFASDNQKFGDTFYMHVPSFAERAEKKQLLEWYSINYVLRQKVPRRPMPVIQHSNDSQVDAVKTADWVGPLATFTNHDYIPGNLVTVPLWRQETKTIVPVGSGAGTVVVPKVAVPYIKTQLYDYAYIDRTQRMLKDAPLDIVFVSNGEPMADQHYAHLSRQVKNLPNQLHRVDRVSGRVQSEQAGAQLSNTSWYFRVPAKLQVEENFDWTWQPDRMQQAKHYIFHAHNPVNGLQYGHMAMIAYNRQLVLQTQGQTLDFATEQLHQVVPILSGTAAYTDSPWTAWRTAFREVIKLRASLPDVESEYRMHQWLIENSDNDQVKWSHIGAEDAVEYYDSVGGDFAALKKSYEWEWLATYAFIKHSLTTG
jgi:hypothetical protein